MEQSSTNQRLTLLFESFGLSARTFSELIGESSTNTQNYVGARNAEPRASYSQNVLNHFNTVNAQWLVTGKGEPFAEGSEPTTNVSAKKTKGQVIGVNNGTVTFQTLADCEKDLADARREVEQLKEQLAAKEALLAAKEKMLSLLRGGHNHPN